MFWGCLIQWSSNLPSNVEKLTFWCPVRPVPAKLRDTSFVRSVRSSRTPPDLPNFNLNYQKNSFCLKPDFSRFTNRSLDNCTILRFLYFVGEIWRNQGFNNLSGLMLVNLGFGIFIFSDLWFSRFLFFCKMILKNLLVRYRGINNKGVLERPWIIWKVLKAISNTLKLQFTVK